MQVRFVVMGNVFPTEVRLHRKYDLKGSLHGRTAGVRKFTEPDTILKVQLHELPSCTMTVSRLSLSMRVLQA